ncbi:hypothetical protein H4Q26_008163 [Puccinia striiformis f. sp. tritici PST-130]|nr:hypothetical protein H4Q26_008163 [Puccinia striiformis f. sp. tritici PST-130]
MLLTKILVALQMLHYYGVSGHPLALSKSLVKRGEGMIEPVLDKLQDLDEHLERLQCMSLKTFWIGRAKINMSAYLAFQPYIQVHLIYMLHVTSATLLTVNQVKI